VGWADGNGVLLRTTSGGETNPVAVSAASLTAPVAPASLATLVGSGLATSIVEADCRSPTTTLGEISLRLYDSAGQIHLAPLFYVSPAQITEDIDDARVYGGIHFRFDQEAGADTGRT
jgi:hypothetical protein